jgi:DNA-binding transcriptional MerR regulator
MDPRIPDKLYFKIGEVAKLAEVPPHVLRYWESEFPGIKPKRANSQQRLYRHQDVELVLRIKSLLHDQGYTIAGARKLLQSGGEATAPPPSSPPPTNIDERCKLRLIKEELRQLQAILIPRKDYQSRR